MIRLLILLIAAAASPSLHAQSYAGRDDVRAFIAEMQERNGLDPDALVRLFARVRPDPAVIKAIKPPKDPSVRSWATYRSRFVEPRRIAAGMSFWRQHEAELTRAEAEYGVPAEIILAIIGVETIYGRNTGNFGAFGALATLAFDYPPRAPLFRGELEALLLLARDEKRDPLAYQGSFAGALGLPQFLPSSLRNWGVDFDGNGRVDPMNPVDAIGSVGNFLKAHGWESGAPIVHPAVVGGEPPPVFDGTPPRLLPADMPNVAAPGAPARPAVLVDFVTPDEPTAYCLGYKNFWVLTRYNRSSFYAMAVYELAEALKAERSGAGS